MSARKLATGKGVVIVDRGKGRWLYRVWDGSSGRYRSKTFPRVDVDINRRNPGCAAGDEWAAKTSAAFVLGTDRAIGDLTMRSLGDAYLAAKESAGRCKQHLNCIRAAVNFAIRDAGVTDLASKGIAAKVQTALARLVACRPGQGRVPASSQTKAHKRTILIAIGAWAVKQDMLQRNPFAAVEKPKVTTNHRKVFTISELRLMLGQEHSADPFFPLVLLAVLTGQRSATLRMMQWEWFDLKNDRILIPGCALKAREASTVPLQPALKAWMQAQHPSDPLAPIVGAEIAKLDPTITGDRFISYLKRVGVDRSDRTLHCVRHSVAGLLTATGMGHFATMDYMSHKDVKTTRHYAKLAGSYKREVVGEGWGEGELRLAPWLTAQQAAWTWSI